MTLKMGEAIKKPDGKVLYYYPARGDGKSLLSIVRYCKELGMTDDEIKELFEKAIKNIGGTDDGAVE